MNGNVLLLRIAQVVLLIALCSACGKIPAAGGISESGPTGLEREGYRLSKDAVASVDNAASIDTGPNLERIAEIERTGAFFPGLAVLESELREKAGDYSGAAIAAYKELSWAYGYGNAARGQIEEGLVNALGLIEAQYTGSARSSGIAAVNGCMAFAGEDWARAEELLSLIPPSEEPDSFLRWMLLVCSLEQEGKNSAEKARSERSGYGAIRARYTNFPEYWYRGARAFTAGAEGLAASYAEQCINTSPNGPFAADCRKILALHLGLGSDGKGIRPDSNNNADSGILTKAEIEHIIRTAVSNNNPADLKGLFPLMALPENPYTIYALGALKSLSSVPEFRSFFDEEARKSKGRLGERLNYISRG